MILYIVTQTGLKSENISSLSSTAQFGQAESLCLENLKHFGFDISKPKDKKKKSILEMLGNVGKTPERAKYELSRHLCPLRQICTELAQNELSSEGFPYLKSDEKITEKTGGGKKGASLFKAEGNDNNTANNTAGMDGGRDLVVFVVGGISYSELRVPYELHAEMQRNFTLGSTTIYQPQEFVRQLQHLSDDKAPPVMRMERMENKEKIETHG